MSQLETLVASEIQVVQLQNRHLHSLFNLFSANYAPVHVQKKIELLDDVHSAWFVAEHDGNVVGLVSVYNSVNQLVAKVQSILVDKGFEDQGIGDALFSAAIDYAKAQKFKYVIGHAVCKHYKSQKMCERHGFDVLGFEPTRIKDPRDPDGKLASLVMYGKQLVNPADIVAPRSINAMENNVKYDAELGKVRITSLHSVFLNEEKLFSIVEEFPELYIEVEASITDAVAMNVLSKEHAGRVFSKVADLPYFSRPYVDIDGPVARFASWPGEFPEKRALMLTPKAEEMYDKVLDAYTIAREFPHHREMVYVCRPTS